MAPYALASKKHVAPCARRSKVAGGPVVIYRSRIPINIARSLIDYVGFVIKTSISEIVKIEIFIPEYDILYYADVLSGFGEKSPCF